MQDRRNDRQLVAAHLAGDGSALAGIYDRYADRLHDTAVAMLRDREEAADATQEVFVVAAARLGQLRDPERLRAWLFAILRNEVYRRSSRRSRTRPTDPFVLGMAEMAPPDHLADAAAVEAAELAAQVRLAAAGLDTRDQLVLELSARQGLSGDELAAALGVSVAQSHVLVHRMRQRVERSLGALTVARMGRRDCPGLAELLTAWDGTFDVLVRKRVARHIERCEVCEQSSRRYAALSLLVLAPAFPAPPGLREKVLATAAAPPSGPQREMQFGAEGGFPSPVASTRRLAPLLAGVAALFVVVLALLSTLAVALIRGGNGGVDEAAPLHLEVAGVSTTVIAGGPTATTVTTATGATGATGPLGSTVPPTGTGSAPLAPLTIPSQPAEVTPPTEAAPQITEPSVAPPPPGVIALSSGIIDLGSSEAAGRLLLTNTGSSPVGWSLEDDGNPAPFSWSAGSAEIGPGATVEIRFSVDRTAMAEGDVSRRFAIRSTGGGGGAFNVLARVERLPAVAIVRSVPRVACPWSVAPPVVATASDESGVASVSLRWSGPGSPGTAPMTESSAGQFRGGLGIGRVNGTWSFDVVATDRRGNIGRASGTIVVSGC
ncbi:MAG: sigma-70 family RNA polymerase sigma factor [Acidimicrobiales bacterium]